MPSYAWTCISSFCNQWEWAHLFPWFRPCILFLYLRNVATPCESLRSVSVHLVTTKMHQDTQRQGCIDRLWQPHLQKICMFIKKSASFLLKMTQWKRCSLSYTCRELTSAFPTKHLFRSNKSINRCFAKTFKTSYFLKFILRPVIQNAILFGYFHA